MRNYLHKFNNKADFDTAYYGSDYHEPWVSLTKSDTPTKIDVIVSYSGNPEMVLNYVENASIDNDGMIEDVYIWQVESGNEAMEWVGYEVEDYIATNIKEAGEYQSGTSIYRVVKNNGQWDFHSEPHSQSIWKLSIISGPKDKVDYNKQFNGDLIVDYAQAALGGEGRWHNGCRIVFAAPNICAEETSYNEYNGYYYNFNEPSVACAHGNKDTLRVRILNLKDTPIDVDFPVDQRNEYQVYRHYSFNDPTMSVNTMSMYITEGSGSPCWGTINIGEAV